MSEALLIELLTEELPPKSLARLGESFLASVRTQLFAGGFIDRHASGRYFATPRRLALLFDAVLALQPDRSLERKGPAVASGVDGEGQPTKALQGFMRSTGVAFTDLERLHDGKAEYFVARIAKPGEPLAHSLAAIVESALKALPVAKIMRWGDGEAQFVRPVHGLVMLHGARVVPGVVLGLASGDTTRGHRFLSQGAIVLRSADGYEAVLEAAGKVVALFSTRRERIERQLLDQAAHLGLMLNAGYHTLLDEVTALVEWPVVYAGEFEEQYLQVPQECLILTMQQNQKYFPLFDAAGRLSHRFLMVSNMQVADPRHIIGGNQRVVRPRLADARFFYDQDRKTPLAARVARLDGVVYHNKLGSLGQRAVRLSRLAGRIAALLHADVAAAERAALLAKADLLTDMVGEFPELQGTMGRYYAGHDGEPPAVAEAIEAHYRPRFAGDLLPEGNVATAVALADRLDVLAGLFGIGQLPTGDKDPFGLRRAALGVLRMLIECALPLDLSQLVEAAIQGFEGIAIKAGTAEALHDFMLERLRHHLREGGHAPEAVDAVLSSRPTRVDRVTPRLDAVKVFVALPEAQALAAANKRIVNILKKAEAEPGEPDPVLLQDAAERDLFARMNELAPLLKAQIDGEDYTAALIELAGLRVPVDRFFDEVMVMADEPLTRQNRLALLARLAGLMNQVADISRLAVAK